MRTSEKKSAYTLTSRTEHERWISRYVTFDEELGMLPCIFCEWSNTVDEAVRQAHDMKLLIRNSTFGLEQNACAVEIVGVKTRLLLRDHATVYKNELTHHRCNPAIRLYDQLIVLEQRSLTDANDFLDILFDTLERNGLEIERLSIGSVLAVSQRQRLFCVRSKNQSLSCVSAITLPLGFEKSDACELYLHWMIDYVATSKRKSDNTLANSDVSDGTATT
jgi:hypothetical protein